MIYSISSSHLRRFKSVSLPPLSSGLSRDIEVPWLAPVTYAVSFVTIVALVILNVALTTYDGIITTTDNFNTTQTLWYHRFTGPPDPGSQCSPYNLTVGQQFTTTANILTYTLLTIDGGKRIFPYEGLPLENCDVISAAVDVDATATTVTNIAYIACNSSGLQITAKTEYVWSMLPSLLDVGLSSPGQTYFSTGYNNASDFVTMALDWVCPNLKALLQAPPPRGTPYAPARISIQGVPSCTTHPYYSEDFAEYCNNDDTVPVTWLYGGALQSYFGFANGTQLPTQWDQVQTTGPDWVNLGFPYDFHNITITDTYLPAITDILQLLISAVRLDVGRILPNNPFLNTTVMNQTLHNPFPDDIQTLPDNGDWPGTIGFLGNQDQTIGYHMENFLMGNSTYINGEYQCRFFYPIGWAQATVNVLVSTLSLFTSGWTIVMAIIALYVSQRFGDTYNYCMGHAVMLKGKSSDRNLDANSSTERDSVDEKYVSTAGVHYFWEATGLGSLSLQYTSSPSISHLQNRVDCPGANQNKEPGKAGQDVWQAANASAWTVTLKFKAGDICLYGGHQWIALNDNVGEEPDTHPEDWKRFDWEDQEEASASGQ